MRNAVLAVVALLVSIPAAAQKAGDTIFVTDRNGIQTDGVLLRTAPEGLTLLVDGQERLIPVAGIGRVEKRDSRWNGMLIGAVPGALIGMMGAGLGCSPHCGRDVPLTALIYGAIGAGIGALIDSQIDGYSNVSGPSLRRRMPAGRRRRSARSMSSGGASERETGSKWRRFEGRTFGGSSSRLHRRR